MKRLIVLILVFTANAAIGELTLDPKTSRLNFISIKNGQVGELHRFTELTGSVDDDGNLEVDVALNSVDTRIEIRDKRMREMLFETAKFPLATYSAKVDTSALKDMMAGEIQQQSVEGELSLHGQTAPLEFLVRITKTSAGSLVVSTVHSSFIKAEDFALGAGIEKLREVAGLKSIASAVPVSFYAVFRPAQADEEEEGSLLDNLMPGR